MTPAAVAKEIRAQALDDLGVSRGVLRDVAKLFLTRLRTRAEAMIGARSWVWRLLLRRGFELALETLEKLVEDIERDEHSLPGRTS